MRWIGLFLLVLGALVSQSQELLKVGEFKNITKNTSGRLVLNNNNVFTNEVKTDLSKIQKKSSNKLNCEAPETIYHKGNWVIQKDTLILIYNPLSDKPQKEKYLVRDDRLFRINQNNTIYSIPTFKGKAVVNPASDPLESTPSF
ncbi:MAG: hypothetical protein HRT72_03180 [Flavobacteriales bacterium]|nr:hypothetical protein [Flavobacteriales bacterium]